MDMLAQDIGWSSHLEIIQLVIVRYQIRVPVLDYISGIGPETPEFFVKFSGTNSTKIAQFVSESVILRNFQAQPPEF